MGLIFFTGSRMVLCFRSATETGNTSMFQLLLNGACMAPRLYPFLTLAPQQVGWEGTADPSWPKRYSVPRHVTLSNASSALVMGGVFPKQLLLRDCLGISLPVGVADWFEFASLGVFFLPLCLWNYPYLDPCIFSCFCSSNSLPIPLAGHGSEQEAGACSITGWGQPPFLWGWDQDSFTTTCPQEITHVERPICDMRTIFWLSCINAHWSTSSLLHHHVALFLSLTAKGLFSFNAMWLY